MEREEAQALSVYGKGRARQDFSVKELLFPVLFSSCLLLGCGEEASCNAKGCVSTASFHYDTPVEGRLYEIELHPGGGSFECEVIEVAGEKEVQCEPVPANWGGEWFTPEGKLSSISWSGAPEGELHITVKVDGKLVTDQHFDHEKSADSEECPMKCTQAEFKLNVLNQEASKP